MGRQEQLALRCHRYDQPGCRSGARPPRNAGHIGQLQSVGVRRRPVETLADTTRSTLLALRALQRPLFRIARPLRRIQCGRDQFQRRLPPQPLSGTPLRCGFILRLSVADRQAVEPRSHSRPGVRPFVGSEISDRRMRRSDPHPVTQLFRADKIGLALIFIIK